MISKNKYLSIVLGIGHFFTDAIASFVLTNVVIFIYIGKANGTPASVLLYFILYNIIAFGGQMIVGRFLDTVEDDMKNFLYSKYVILMSCIFYILGLILALESIYLSSIVFIGIGSALFHVGAGNISLLSGEKKATLLGIFASGGVVGLSFGWLLAFIYPNLYSILFISPIILCVVIYFRKDYSIAPLPSSIQINLPFRKDYIVYFVLFLIFTLALRSAIWTKYQYVFYDYKLILFYLALAAALGKVLGGYFEDLTVFKEKYFVYIGILSILLLLVYNYIYNELFILLFAIFGITLFISPLTLMMYNLFPKRRGIIIGYTFGFSLLLGYLLYILLINFLH